MLKSSLDKMIQLLLPKIQFTEKTNLHIYLARNFTNVHNNIQLVLRRLYRQVVLQFLYPPWGMVIYMYLNTFLRLKYPPQGGHKIRSYILLEPPSIIFCYF